MLILCMGFRNYSFLSRGRRSDYIFDEENLKGHLKDELRLWRCCCVKKMLQPVSNITDKNWVEIGLHLAFRDVYTNTSNDYKIYNLHAM